ncbi:hypothetical protein Tco_1272777 [Tanacetum coccineum]
MIEDDGSKIRCYYPKFLPGFDKPQLPQDSVDHQKFLQALDKIQEELEEIKRDRRKKIKDMSMRNEAQSQFKVRIKEQAYNEERYSAARRRMLSITFDDDDEYSIQTQEYLKKFSSTITPVLPIEEPDNSLSMGDEHLDTIPSIENLVPIPSEFEGISDDTSDMPNCDNYESASELAHFAPILPGIINLYLELRHSAIMRTEGTRSVIPLHMVYNSLPEYDSFLFEIEPDQGRLISIDVSDNSNNTLLELPEFESFHFDPSFPRPPPNHRMLRFAYILSPMCP